MNQRPRRVLCLVDNMFFGARVEDAARRLGLACDFARDAEDFRGRLKQNPPGLVLVDMAGVALPWQALLPDLKRDIATADIPVLAFGRHTQSALFKLARRAGVDRAVTNAELAEHLPDLLREYLGATSQST